MRRIGIVGAGQSGVLGVLLALCLLRHGYNVTVVMDRTAEEVRSGPVMSSQCLFDSGLTIERQLGVDAWSDTCPYIERMTIAIGESVNFAASFEYNAQSVDQRGATRRRDRSWRPV